MKPTTSLSISFCLCLCVTVLAGVAFAQEVAAPPPQAVAAQPPSVSTSGPTTTPPQVLAHGDQVSMINGHPIRIGEHNEYYYGYRRWNISTNPVAWMAGVFGASVSYGFHRNVAVHARFNVYTDTNNWIDYDYDGGGFDMGVGVPIYFRRTFQGAFLQPGFYFRQFEIEGYATPLSSPGTESVSEVGPEVLVGWHWSWDSGLNIAAAAGVARNLNENDSYYGNDYYGNDGIVPTGYLRFGYSF